MQLLDMYSVIVTSHNEACRDFYALQVEDAAEFARLAQAGQTEPAPGFWDPYVS